MSTPQVESLPGRLDGPVVRPATCEDAAYIENAFEEALSPYYGGNHRAHARRIIRTHLAGGQDRRGSLSSRQLLLILWEGGKRRGLLNLVFKRQGTCKISPLIVHPLEDETLGLGSTLLKIAEEQSQQNNSRQLYCTVAERNRRSLEFFLKNGFIVCGSSPDQYKAGETEISLRRPILRSPEAAGPDTTISVTLVNDTDWPAVRRLLFSEIRKEVQGASKAWLDSLRQGATQIPELDRAERRPNWTFAAVDRAGRKRAAAIISRKKGNALKIMPIASADIEAFQALIIDLPSLLAGKGRKAYIHLAPSPRQIEVLQQHGWRFEANLPGAYHPDIVSQQWAFTLVGNDYMRSLRIRDEYLQLISLGKKTLEIRVAYDHLKSIKAGDRLRFVSTASDDVVCQVVSVRRYTNFAEMLQHEDSNLALPDMKPSEALQRLREIYPHHKERLGVLVIELRKEWD